MLGRNKVFQSYDRVSATDREQTDLLTPVKSWSAQAIHRCIFGRRCSSVSHFEMTQGSFCNAPGRYLQAKGPSMGSSKLSELLLVGRTQLSGSRSALQKP